MSWADLLVAGPMAGSPERFASLLDLAGAFLPEAVVTVGPFSDSVLSTRKMLDATAELARDVHVPVVVADGRPCLYGGATHRLLHLRPGAAANLRGRHPRLRIVCTDDRRDTRPVPAAVVLDPTLVDRDEANRAAQVATRHFARVVVGAAPFPRISTVAGGPVATVVQVPSHAARIVRLYSQGNAEVEVHNPIPGGLD